MVSSPWEAFLTDERSVRHTPVARGHGKDSVGCKAGPLRVRSAEANKVRYEYGKSVFVPGVNRRHKLDLSVYQLPPLPFFTGSQELLPRHSGLCCHDFLTGGSLSRLDSVPLLFEPHFSIPAISAQPHDSDRQ